MVENRISVSVIWTIQSQMAEIKDCMKVETMYFY